MGSFLYTMNKTGTPHMIRNVPVFSISVRQLPLSSQQQCHIILKLLIQILGIILCCCDTVFPVFHFLFGCVHGILTNLRKILTP